MSSKCVLLCVELRCCACGRVWMLGGQADRRIVRPYNHRVGSKSMLVTSISFRVLAGESKTMRSGRHPCQQSPRIAFLVTCTREMKISKPVEYHSLLRQTMRLRGPCPSVQPSEERMAGDCSSQQRYGRNEVGMHLAVPKRSPSGNPYHGI